jgi:hypothetical protein
VAERHPPLAVVDVRDPGRVEERQDGSVERRELAASDRNADHDRRDRLRDRLHCVEIAPAIEGVPPGVEVVVGAGEVVSVEGPRCLCLRGVDLVVVVRVAPFVGDLAVADDEHAVDVAVLAARDVGVEGGEDLRVEPDRFRLRRRPLLRERLGRGLRREADEQDGESPERAHHA